MGVHDPIRTGMELLLASTAGTGFGLWLFFDGFRTWRRMRLIADTPTAKVRSMPMGRVELEGRAQGKAELAAPLTGSPCVYYRYQIEQEVKEGKNRKWRTIASGDSGAWPFYLEDGTGRALVDPRGAKVDIPHDWREVDPPLAGPLSVFLAEQGIDTHGWFFRKKMRFTEWHVAPGDVLYVLGVAQERPGLAAERRQRISDKLAALKRDPEAMAHLDTNGDGRIDADEWEVARRLVVREVSFAPVDDRVVVGAAPNREAPFYISDRPQEQVLSTHRWRSLGSVFGGAALAVACAAFLVGQLLLWLGNRELGRF